jgi:hypothetical protein
VHANFTSSFYASTPILLVAWSLSATPARRGAPPTFSLRRSGSAATLGYVDDDAIRLLLNRLARAHPSGGTVIERAAIVAEGTGSEEVLTWMIAHGAEPEAPVATPARRGLHGSDLHARGGSGRSVPSRYILPPGVLDPS